AGGGRVRWGGAPGVGGWWVVPRERWCNPPAVNVTVAVCVMAVPLIVTDTVLLSALVEAKVPVVCPLASVAVLGCTSVFPVPVAASTTLAAAIPLITFPLASLAVTVIVLVATPLATTLLGLTTIVELPALT